MKTSKLSFNLAAKKAHEKMLLFNFREQQLFRKKRLPRHKNPIPSENVPNTLKISKFHFKQSALICLVNKITHFNL